MDGYVQLRVCAFVRLTVCAYDQLEVCASGQLDFCAFVQLNSCAVVHRVCECLSHDLLDGLVLLTSYVPAIFKQQEKQNQIISHRKIN